VPSFLDLDKLDAAYGYTVDGEGAGRLHYECFNASPGGGPHPWGHRPSW